jgi:hypothetical protein
LTENNENNPIGEIISVDTTSSEETKNEEREQHVELNTPIEQEIIIRPESTRLIEQKDLDRESVVENVIMEI